MKAGKVLKPNQRRVKFGDVVRLSKTRCQDPLAEGYERFIGLEHLEPGDLRIRSWGNVADGTTFTNVFKPGQVLFGKRRAYQRKVAVADFAGVCSGDIYVLESQDTNILLPELLPFICQTNAFFEYSVGTSAGSLSPRTNWSSLADFEFALLPMEEQRRIVNVLLTANRVLEGYNELLRSASRLLSSSLEQAIHSSSQFPQRSIEDLCHFVMDFRGRTPKKLGMGWGGGKIPALSANNVLHRRLDLEKETNYGSEALYEKWMTHGDLIDGDILFTTEAPLGNVFRLKGNQKYILSQRVIALRVNRELIKDDYFEALLCSTYFRRELDRLATGSTAKGIRVGSLVTIKFPVPPISYQEKWAKTITEISDAEAAAEKRLSTIRALASKFREYSVSFA